MTSTAGPGRFANYEPDARRGSVPADLRTRPAQADDLRAVAALHAARNGTDIDRSLEGFRRDLDRADRLLLVAEVDGEIVGYGRAGVFPPQGDTVSTVPRGWYLLGVVVALAWRRRGIGEALTVARLEQIAARAEVVRYFASARNPVSLDLHAKLGFRETARDIAVRGVSFTGGSGVLFELRTEPPADR